MSLPPLDKIAQANKELETKKEDMDDNLNLSFFEISKKFEPK